LRSSLSKSTTGAAGVRSTGSPNSRIAWIAKGHSVSSRDRLSLVTPPLPQGSGFSLSRFRSLAKGKPCPQDVDRRVHVGVRGMPAPRTSEFGLGDAVLRSAVPTSGAGARGVGGVHRDQLSTGAFSLVRQDRQKHPPTRIHNRTVQTGFRRD